MERLVKIESFEHWKDCIVRLSLYPNGTIRGDIYSLDGRYLMELSSMGTANSTVPLMYVPDRKCALKWAVIEEFMELDIIRGCAPLEDGSAVCILTNNVFEPDPDSPISTRAYARAGATAAAY